MCLYRGKGIYYIVVLWYELRYSWKELDLCMIEAFHCIATSSLWNYNWFLYKFEKKKNKKIPKLIYINGH